MCLIVFAFQPETQFPLILAANRDEFFARATREAAFWTDSDQSQILAGKDLEAGGTWLGISRGGRFAAVTNIRDPSQTEVKPRSRGELTLGFLTGSLSAADYCAELLSQFQDFAGFNLLLGDGRDLYYANNQNGVVDALEPGIHGLSNGLLDSDWPKVRRSREQLGELLGQAQPPSTDRLIQLMTDREQAAEDELPDTGLPLPLERTLSSMFIENSSRGYGTRCSTALVMAAAGTTRFSEQNYDAGGAAARRHYFEFQVSNP